MMRFLGFLVTLPFLILFGLWFTVLIAPIFLGILAFGLGILVVGCTAVCLGGFMVSLGWAFHKITGRWPEWMDVVTDEKGREFYISLKSAKRPHSQ